MKLLKFDTDTLPEKDQFAYWSEGLHSATGVTTRRDEQANTPFHLKVVHAKSRFISLNRFEIASPCTLANPGTSIAKHSNSYIGMQFRLSGDDLASTFGRNDNPTKTGDLRLFDMQQPWEYRLNGYSVFSVYINRTDLLRRMPSVEHLHGVILRDNPLVDVLKQTLISVAKILQEADTHELEAVSHSLLPLAADTINLQSIKDFESTEVRSSSVLQTVIKYVEANYGDHGLCPEKIAKSVGISRTKLYRICSPFGTPMDFVREIRLRKAAGKLRLTNQRNIEEIAYATGFSGRQAFHRAFKEQYDMAPSDYRILARTEANPGATSCGKFASFWENYRSMATSFT
ncbi:helix-turn-helix transcriptional regulator [Roseibium sp. SCP14]|uniref:helix-turn-helix transcriptional regulator n=1 Tax=Roseibium sp. SCP14 TaxID=3141375 RepID=UPI0033366C1E